MLDFSKLKRWVPCTAISLICLFAVGLLLLENISKTDPEEPLSFILVSNEELLDQIFEEEKSNRVCRFIKTRKMKA